VLLFLSIAFFFLEHQDGEKYARLFAFDWPSVTHGELWRLVTYQFTQAGQGWFAFPKPVVLFFSLLLLYLMGSAIEEEWGTSHFLTFFALSTLGSAAAAAAFGIPLLGSYFINFTLLFGYASTFPQQTFFLFGVIPVRVRWLAYIAAMVLIAGVFAGGRSNAAALAGAAAAYTYYLTQRIRIVVIDKSKREDREPGDEIDSTAIRNASRFVAIKRAVSAGRAADVDRLIAQAERDIVRGVNICPPVDFKPESTDGYCIRCEGFAECSARFLAMHRPPAESNGGQAPSPVRTT
jgi:membrane associated rhomboid family serine protease